MYSASVRNAHNMILKLMLYLIYHDIFSAHTEFLTL